MRRKCANVCIFAFCLLPFDLTLLKSHLPECLPSLLNTGVMDRAQPHAAGYLYE